MKKEDLIPLNNTIVFESNLSNNAIATYYALENLIRFNIKPKYITMRMLAYYLTGKLGLPYVTESKVKDGFLELCESNIISIQSEYKGSYIIDFSESVFGWKKSNFVVVQEWEVNRIFSLKGVEPFTLFKYFLAILKCLTIKNEKNEYVIGCVSLKTLSDLSDVSESTAIYYNTVLETEELIYVHRFADTIFIENENVVRVPNIYGRYENKKCIDEYADKLMGERKPFGNSQLRTKTVNMKRRYAQIYNQLVKGIDKEKYTTEELQEVYDYVLDENLKYQNLYKQKNDESYLQKLRDVNVFKEYGFAFEK